MIPMAPVIIVPIATHDTVPVVVVVVPVNVEHVVDFVVERAVRIPARGVPTFGILALLPRWTAAFVTFLGALGVLGVGTDVRLVPGVVIAGFRQIALVRWSPDGLRLHGPQIVVGNVVARCRVVLKSIVYASRWLLVLVLD